MDEEATRPSITQTLHLRACVRACVWGKDTRHCILSLFADYQQTEPVSLCINHSRIFLFITPSHTGAQDGTLLVVSWSSITAANTFI